MPALTQTERTRIGAKFQEDASLTREPLGAVLKADIQAAVAAADDWLVANLASFNNALPQPARAALTTTQKARLLVFVIERRYETGA
jgi:hypothetical protein